MDEFVKLKYDVETDDYIFVFNQSYIKFFKNKEVKVSEEFVDEPSKIKVILDDDQMYIIYFLSEKIVLVEGEEGYEGYYVNNLEGEEGVLQSIINIINSFKAEKINIKLCNGWGSEPILFKFFKQLQPKT